MQTPCKQRPFFGGGGETRGVRISPSAPCQYSKGFRLSAGVPFALKMARVAFLRLA
jgi:hypothetical protein